MMQTSIEWTATRLADGRVLPGYTWNPWWGCVKVSPACKFCYAQTWAKRYGVEWGPTARRKFQSESYWQEPVKWDRKAAKLGARLKVFCASMADVFEELPAGHPDAEQMVSERARLLCLIHRTPNLDWLLLTKRPENVTRLWDQAATEWGEPGTLGMPLENVWIGTTVEDQEQAEKRIPELLKIPARVRFLSCEPLLGPIDLSPFHIGWSGCAECGTVHDPCQQFPLGSARACGGDLDAGIDCDFYGRLPVAGLHLHWVIAGGESGHGARPMHPECARGLRDQCEAAGVPFHFKQWGEWLPCFTEAQYEAGTCFPGGDERVGGDCGDPGCLSEFRGGRCLVSLRDGTEQRAAYVNRPDHRWGKNSLLEMTYVAVGKKAAGRLLDGRTWDEFPQSTAEPSHA